MKISKIQKKYRVTLMFSMLLFTSTNLCFADAALREASLKSMLKASVFFREKVSIQGGYLWRYSEDLTLREGEKKADDSTIWVQPPGTPSVGEAFLKAYKASGETIHLNAARDAGYALLSGQLESGGWYYNIDLSAENARKYRYRKNIANGVTLLPHAKNLSILDDNVSQSALLFLIHLDQALDFKDQQIHQAIDYGLKHLIKAQYSNGAWPQRFDHSHNPLQYNVIKARFPDSWPQTHPKKKYHSYYTLNDNVMADIISTLLEAYKIYGDKELLLSAERAGDFLILAQMPEPQPAWAQQYNPLMEPAWARRYEPPAISGRESQAVIFSLMELFRETGNEKFLTPLPAAFLWLERSVLADGKLARFYELKTNTPLYFTKNYQLSYQDDNLPKHYAFKVGSRIKKLKKKYACLVKASSEISARFKCLKKKNPALKRSFEDKVKKVIAALDTQGRWINQGKLYYQGEKNFRQSIETNIISSKVFSKNMSILSQYIAATNTTTQQ